MPEDIARQQSSVRISATELCKDLGVKDKWLSRHLLGDTPFRLDELELLDSILNFTDIELAQIVRGRDESKI